MNADYVTTDGRYYVTYHPSTGTYDICEWPSQRVVATRDWQSQACAEADRRAAVSGEAA